MSASSWWSLPWRWLADAPTLDQAIQDDFTAVETAINELFGGGVGAWTVTGTPPLSGTGNDPLPLTVKSSPVAPTPKAFSLSPDTKTITVGAPGWYFLSGWVQITPSSSAQLSADIRSPSLNETLGIESAQPATFLRGNPSAVAYLRQGETIQLRGYSSTGGTAQGGRIAMARFK